MIKINKQGNALKIEFTDNDKYLNEGVMEIAPNELMVVVDSSDMATFKRVTNGDVLFSQTIDKIQIAGSAVTKDSILGAFASIGYTSGGGGGGTGAVSSVNGQTGDVVLTADSLGVYTKAEVDTKINGLNDKVTNAVDVAGGAAQLADDVDESLKSHIRDFNSYKEEVRDELAGKQPVGEYATKSELSGEVTSLNESINKKANTDYVDGELAKKADKTQLDAYQLKGDYALKSDLTKYFDNAKYEDKRINFYNGQTVVAWIDATPFIKDGMVVDAKIEDGYLVITFNSDAELDPIKIPITDIFNPDNYYTVTIIDEKLAEKVSNTDFNAYKEEVSSNLDKKLDKSQYETDKETFLTKTEAGQKYQPVGDYVTGEKLNTELSSKADKSELVGLASKTDVEDKIDEKLADYYDKTEVDEAIEDAIPDLSDFVTDSELKEYTYDKKTIDEKVAQGGTFDPTNYYDKSDVDGLLKDKADTDSVPTLQQEVKGTEKNYIYSDPTVQGKGAIAAARYRANSNGKLTAQYKYWGDTDFNYNTEFPTATQTADGVMSKEDKIKLDSLTPGGGGTVDAYTKQEADNKFATKTQLNSKAPLPSTYNLVGAIQYDYVGQQGNSLTYGTQVSYNQINLGDIFDDGNYKSIVVAKGYNDGYYIVQLMPFHTNNPYVKNKGTMLGYQILFTDPSQETNNIEIFGLGIDGFNPKTIKAKSSSFSSLTNSTSTSASITISSGNLSYSSVNIGDYLEITNSSSSTQILTLQVIGKYRNGSSYYIIFSGYQNVQLYVHTETTSSTKTLTKYINFDPTALSNILIGQGIVGTGSNNVAIGSYAGVQNQQGQDVNYGVAIGAGAMAQGDSAVAIGAYGATATGNYSTAIGGQSTANDATVIGSNLSNTNGEKVVIGHNGVPLIKVDSAGNTSVVEGSKMKQVATKDDITGKQDTLKSGTNIKTINGESILGSGNIEISGGGGGSSNKVIELEHLDVDTPYYGWSTYFKDGQQYSYNDINIGDTLNFDNDYQCLVTNKYKKEDRYYIQLQPLTFKEYQTIVFLCTFDTEDDQEQSLRMSKQESGQIETYNPKTIYISGSLDELNSNGEASFIHNEGGALQSVLEAGDFIKINYQDTLTILSRVNNKQWILGGSLESPLYSILDTEITSNTVTIHKVELGGGDSYTREEADERFAEKGAVPTVQTSKNGTEGNYIYAAGKNTTGWQTYHNVIADIEATQTSTELYLGKRQWGDDGSVYKVPLPFATTEKAGVMSASDKTKLDSIPQIQVVTQEEYDSSPKTAGVLYLIKEG